MHIGRSVSFKVEKGDAWEKENQIYKKNQGLIYEIPPNQDHFLCLGDPQIREEGEVTYIRVPVECEGDELPANLRVHLYGSNFMSSDMSGVFDPREFRNPSPVLLE